MMTDKNSFLKRLQDLNVATVNKKQLALLQPILDDPNFNPDRMRAMSAAGGGMATWVLGVY